METRNMKTLGWLPAAIAAGYVLFATYPHGVGITSDSIHYFTSARHFLEVGTLATYTGEPLVSYAPFLSVVYALLGLVDVNVQLSARLVGALSFAAVVYIGWRWLEEMQVSARLLWIGIALVLSARPLLWYAPYALSELPFIALTTGALWNAWRYVHNGRRAYLFASMVMAGLSALTRWIGVTTVLSVGLFLLLAYRRTGRRHPELVTGYVLLALVPFLLWMLRSRLLTGTFFGIREPSDYPIRQMVFDALWSLHRWVVPVAFENSVPLFAVLVGLGMVPLILALRLEWSNGKPPAKQGLILLALFIGLYALALITMSRGAKFETLSERLWSPIAVPLAMCVVLLQNMLRTSSRLTQMGRGMLTLVIIGWCVSGFAFGAEMIAKCYRDGPGVFNTSAWRDSETMRWLRGHRLSGRVYSNFAEPLYYFTGVIADYSPHKGPMRVASETHPRNLQQFLQKVQDDWKTGHRVYLVWFKDKSRSEYLYDLDELREYIALRLIKELRDGAVYEVQQFALGRRL